MRGLKAWGRAGIQVSWGLVDQGFSSATNFGLTVIAGRLVGPNGLGVVYIGFSLYLFVLSFQRALITDPLVVSSAPLDAYVARGRRSRASTLVLTGGVVATALMLLLSTVVPGPVGRGLALFAPWMVLALAQDFWRALLFRNGRGRGGGPERRHLGGEHGAHRPDRWWTRSEWAIVATLGCRRLARRAVGFAQTRMRPVRPGVAWRWWREEASTLGRWLGLENVPLAAQGQVLIIVLAAVLGARDLGGLRVVEAVFAPMSLVGEAMGLPGLPILSQSLATSFTAARRWAVRLSLITVALVLAYLLVAGRCAPSCSRSCSATPSTASATSSCRSGSPIVRIRERLLAPGQGRESRARPRARTRARIDDSACGGIDARRCVRPHGGGLGAGAGDLYRLGAHRAAHPSRTLDRAGPARRTSRPRTKGWLGRGP